MPKEQLLPAQHLEAAKGTLFSPLPAFDTSNQALLKQSYISRAQFINHLNSVLQAKPNDLGGRNPVDVVKTEDLRPRLAQALYESTALLTSDPEITGILLGKPDRDAIIKTTLDQLTPFIADMKLGKEIADNIDPKYKKDVIPVLGTSTEKLIDDYYTTVTSIVEATNTSKTRVLDPNERLHLAQNIVKVTIYVSHPVIHIAEKVRKDTGQDPLKVVSSGFGILRKQQLGPEMSQLLKKPEIVAMPEPDSPPTPPAQTPEPTPIPAPEPAPPAPATTEPPPPIAEPVTITIMEPAPPQAPPPPPATEHAPISSPIRDTSDSDLLRKPEQFSLPDTAYLSQISLHTYREGFGTPESLMDLRTESKSGSANGESHLSKFEMNFVDPVGSHLEKDLQTPDNILRVTSQRARIELLMIQALGEPVRSDVLSVLDPTHKPSVVEEALRNYEESVMDNLHNPRNSVTNEIIQIGNESYSAGEILNILLDNLVKRNIQKEGKRNFGIAELIVKQYRENPNDDYLYFIARMNELATNDKTRSKIGFMNIF